jgi:hypothetical protein
VRVGLHALLHVLLQQRLVVLGMPVFPHLVDLGHEQPLHEPFGGVESRVQVVGADDGFKRVGEDGLLAAPSRVFLAPADEDVVVDPQPSGDFRQAGLAHHEALDPRQFPFGLVGQLLVKVLCHHEAQHRVAEELEALIVPERAPGLIGPGSVGERPLQVLQLAELDGRVALEELELLPALGPHDPL